MAVLERSQLQFISVIAGVARGLVWKIEIALYIRNKFVFSVNNLKKPNFQSLQDVPVIKSYKCLIRRWFLFYFHAMLLQGILIIATCVNVAFGQPGKCDQTPVGAKVLTPAQTKNMPYIFGIKTKNGTDYSSYGKFYPDQTYVLILEMLRLGPRDTRPFKDFMITAEDPSVDNNIYYFEHQKVDVGTLKTLEDDYKTTYSERCHNSVENTDKSDKTRIEVHWVSPKTSVNGQKIRFRAMVAENDEKWYTGDGLTITLEKDDAIPLDTPPLKLNEDCKLCSEARYEVIFQGKWSRGTHSLHFPNKPDETRFSPMIGASHDIHYELWKQGVKASDGLKLLAEEAKIELLEAYIVSNMSKEGGTRTLIKGKGHEWVHMSEPSYSLLRVDRIHHLFSLVVAMKPSPDWFLGTTQFELCKEDGWLDYWKLPMYPWDAGTLDGISYDSPREKTDPVDNVDRVAMGSFNKESPFYQMNMNDLKPFAILEVRKLDEYPLIGVCSEDAEEIGDKNDKKGEEGDEQEESNDGPAVAESRAKEGCSEEWSAWSDCSPYTGICGRGVQIRTHFRPSRNNYHNYNANSVQVKPLEKCEEEQETQNCFIECQD